MYYVYMYRDVYREKKRIKQLYYRLIFVERVEQHFIDAE